MGSDYEGLIVDTAFNRLVDNCNPGPNRPILKDIRGKNILAVKNVIKKGLTFNHHNHENCSLNDVFPQFLGATINYRTEITSIVV